MSDYTQVTDFSAKDALTTGDPDKLIRGADVDGEFDAISTAIATKYDSGDIASTAEARALSLDNVLITPSKLDDALNQVLSIGSRSGTGAVTVYADGSPVLFPTATALILRPATGDDARLGLESAAGVDQGRLWMSGSDLYLDSMIASQTLNLRVANGAGTLQSALVATGGGDLVLYRAGTAVMSSYLDNLAGVSIGSGALRLRGYNASDTDIVGLVSGSNFGALAEGDESGHFVVGIRGNDTSDSFSIVGTATAGADFDTIMLRVRVSGATDLTHSGSTRLSTASAGVDIFGATSALLDVIATGANNDPVLGLRGATNGGLRLYWDESASIAYLRQTAASGTVEDVWLELVKNGKVGLRYNNTEEALTQDSDANYSTSGLQTNDHGQTLRDVGFNLLPVVEADASQTFDEDDVSKMIHRDGTTSITYTLASGTSGAVPPVGATIMIANENATGTVTIAASGTLRWFNGEGTPSTGDRSLAHGGVATVYKYADTEWWIWGNGLS